MSDKKRKFNKHRTVMPYITTPVVFVLISLIAVLPMCLVMLGLTEKYVHKAQNAFSANISDFVAYDDGYKPSDKTEGTVRFTEPEGFSKVGEISCSSAGLNVPVYYGSNRVNFRSGSGLKSQGALPGTGGSVIVKANPSGGFKALYNVKTGDIITFETGWGVYKYKVDDIGLNLSEKSKDGESLTLITAPDKSAFSVLSGNVYTVIAELVSGPKAEEVQNEQ